MARLAATCDAVLMDLRSFSPKNQGCIFELGRLLDGVDLTGVIFLIDKTTDVRFLENTLYKLWQSLSTESPNQTIDPPIVQLFPLVKYSKKQLSDLVRLLLRTVPANSADLNRAKLRMLSQS